MLPPAAITTNCLCSSDPEAPGHCDGSFRRPLPEGSRRATETLLIGAADTTLPPIAPKTSNICLGIDHQ
jgi:hypothetical protein